MASAFHTSAGSQPLQPGLGDFARLPLEIRRAIWEYLIPENADGTRDSSSTCGLGCTIEESRALLPRRRRGLVILRTSKVLYNEITEELYRNRVLTICINDQEHWPGGFCHEDENPEPFWATIGGVCARRNLRHIDFSRFDSLRLNIRVPNDDDLDEPFEALNDEIKNCARSIERWQKKNCHGAGYPSLKIDVAISVCPDKPGYIGPGEEVCLDDIVHIVFHLGRILKVRLGSIEVVFPLRYGQEWLVEAIRQVVENIKFHRTTFRREGGTRIQEALDMSHKMTRDVIDTGYEALPMPPLTPVISEGVSASVRHRVGMERVANLLKACGWMVDPSIVTKITFE